MATASATRSPRWYGVPVRIALLTFIGTLTSFVVSLFLGIIGTVVASAFRHVHPDMRVAYRQVALPMALVAGSVILILATIMEVRQYRQAKALSAIERMG
jgi:ABC-type spermidine/putrescine transport system permease subunit I